MTTQSDAITFPIRLFNDGESPDYEDVNNIGRAAQKSAFDVLAARMFGTQSAGAALTMTGGFLGVDWLAIKGGGDLGVTIGPGVGFFSRPETEGTDPTDDVFAPQFVPLILREQVNITVGAHDATNPRIDLVCVKWSPVEDESAALIVEDVGGAITNPTLPTRGVDGYTLSVVAGTPAGSPTAPAVPSGYVLLAHVLVPATSGPVEVEDWRTVIRLSRGMADAPVGALHARNCVAGGLAVTDNASGLKVDVAIGGVFISGIYRPVVSRTVTMATADATNPRIDTVYVEDGIIKVATGTPSASDDPPVTTLTSAQIPLAFVNVPAGATTLSSGDITDAQQTSPYSDSLQSVVTVDAVVDVYSNVGPLRVVDIQCADADARRVATQTVAFELEFFDYSTPPTLGALDMSAIGTYCTVQDGTVLLGADGAGTSRTLVVLPDNTGLVSLIFTNGSAFASLVYMRIRPIEFLNANTLATDFTTNPKARTRRYRAGRSTSVLVGTTP